MMGQLCCGSHHLLLRQLKVIPLWVLDEQHKNLYTSLVFDSFDLSSDNGPVRGDAFVVRECGVMGCNPKPNPKTKVMSFHKGVRKDDAGSHYWDEA